MVGVLAELLQRRLELPHHVDLERLVVGAEEPEQRRLQRAPASPVALGEAVVHDDGVDVARAAAGRSAAPSRRRSTSRRRRPCRRPPCRAGRRRPGAGSPRPPRGCAIASFISACASSGVLRALAAVEVDGEGGVAVRGELAREVADVVVEPPPFVDEDDRRSALGGAFRLRERALHGLAADRGVLHGARDDLLAAARAADGGAGRRAVVRVLVRHRGAGVFHGAASCVVDWAHAARLAPS